jgi:lysyl-tRNA synthetase class 2
MPWPAGADTPDCRLPRPEGIVIERNEDLMAGRLAKAQRLRERGLDPYPARVERTHTTAQAVAELREVEARGGEPPQVVVAGRVTNVRRMGRASFLDLRDGSGRVQVYVRRDTVGEEGYALLDDLDLGDFLAAAGPMFRTRTGEPTVEAWALTFLAKAILPPPEKWHGLQDVELRYRRRYLDLIANEEVRRIFRLRSEVVAYIRRFMDARGFMEVETPVLLPEAGGAAARPFVTHHNALDEDRYLRIATELHLKRLIIGGFDKVYEIGRIFRNEGIGYKWNPEFTMLESYEAYADYFDVAEMVEQMVSGVAAEVLGSMRVPYKDSVLDFAPPWRRASMHDLLIEHAGFDWERFRDLDALRAEVARRGIRAAPGLGWGKLIDEIWSAEVEPKLVQPVFVFDYPVELSPLAKRKADESGLVERFEAFAGGFEIGNAYSELNDPLDQRRRFEEQVRLRAAGDDEAEMIDDDFLFALEHGMPPTGGLGMGIDRLLMVLLDQQSIREVILFPQLRRES